MSGEKKMDREIDDTIQAGQEVVIDRFHPGDAEGIVRLFKAVYGETYAIPDYTDPDLLREKNRTQDVVSVVGRTPSGDIVGHTSIYRSAPVKDIYENGAGVVHPLYRGTSRIMSRMGELIMTVAEKEMPVTAVFFEPICSHTYTQRIGARHGAPPFALEMNLMPRSLYDGKGAEGRVSALLQFRIYRHHPQHLYLPSVYAPALKTLYWDLIEKREIVISDKSLPAGKKTALKIKKFDFAKVARITVETAGTDFPSTIRKKESSLVSGGTQVIQIWLPLSWPYVGEAVDHLRAMGYFLGGPLPHWLGCDALFMQKLQAPPSWEDMVFYQEEAHQVLEIIRADWEKVQQQ